MNHGFTGGIFIFSKSLKLALGSPPASYSLDTRGVLAMGTTSGSWSWLLRSIYCQGQE